MSSILNIVLFIVTVCGNVLALEELPQVEKNNILETDIFIRETTNKIFSLLKFKVDERPALKQYSLIHNYLVSTSLHDYTSLIEISKLTRIDKTKLNNQTKHFMAKLNEILNEDIKHDTTMEDQCVVQHVKGFLKNLDEYTDAYNYKENNVDIIIAEILELLEKNKTLSELYSNGTGESDSSWLKSSDENDTIVDENEFWVPSGRRIYRGKKTNIKDFPFMASIQIFNHFQCAGSIIKSDLIITAASCLQLAYNNRFFRENPAFLSARVGSTFHNGGGENIPILEVYFHPGYDPRTLNNNLCLLRLYRVLHFAKKKHKLKKIAIDRHANALPTNTDGITVVGWGARRRSNVIADPYLSFAVLDFYLLQECQEVYSKKYVTRKNFCAGFISVGGGACNRDIGGPGIVHGVLAGVVSFGSPVCGTPDAPTVFTKLGYYAEWIDSIMEQDVLMVKQRTTTLSPKFITAPTSKEEVKTTFKMKPPVFPKKPTLLEDIEEVEILRKLKDEDLFEFINSLVGSKEAEKLLREATEMESTKPPSNEKVERIPFIYSPVTTLEPPILSSTVMNIIETDEKKMNTETRLHKSFRIQKKNPSENAATHKRDIENELNEKLEQDIIKILDEINLEDYIKDRHDTGNKKKMLRTIHEKDNIKDVLTILYLSDNEQKDFSDYILSDESRSSDEIGLEIIADMFENLNNTNVKIEDMHDSNKVILQVVAESLKDELQNKTSIEEFENKEGSQSNSDTDELWSKAQEKAYKKKTRHVIIENKKTHLKRSKNTTVTTKSAIKRKSGIIK